ncbi:class I SAM-dependent methyltransferase [Photobacterium sp. SDRW27]|uniref:class I SAM-dependent methyltransferase n=1 Tax=Photobacterium obscurum TaxID=2829490 RepID=UPI0022445333|nr:class I SAM-dependent methyltransferase [Photobacterium obscurum]MCW8327408.1 class I SAM-dependent methyltransferase [Photobacterium obscurum]
METSALPTLEQHLLNELMSPPTEVRRLFHGRGRCWQGLEQLTVDWLGGQVLVSLFKEPSESFLTALNQLLIALTESETWQNSGAKSLLLQHRDRQGSPMEILWGESRDYQDVVENGLTFKLDLGRKQNNGLFLDMRYGRDWVMRNASGKRVLNLFAYTCGFSVAAIEGGAEHVVNLDMAKAALSRGRDNHHLNKHDLKKVSFLGHELFKSWGKVRKLGPYDMIIIDPPSFQKGSFALTKDYQKILRRLPELLTESGQVVACVNDPSVSSQFLIDGMAAEAPELTFTERLDNPPEFKDIEPEGGLKVLVFDRS